MTARGLALAGFNWGKLGTIGSGYSYGSSTDKSVSKQFTYSPSVSFRYGNLSKVFVEYRYAGAFPSSYPALQHQFALGFGFGKRDGGAVRIGTGSYASFFMAPSIPAGEHLIVEPFIGIGPGFGEFSLFGGGSQRQSGFIGSISLHYKFNRKEKR